MQPRLRCTITETGYEVVLPVTGRLAPIYDLLVNGVNTQLILVKAPTEHWPLGQHFVYEVA